MRKLILLTFLASCNLIDPPTHVTDDLQIFVDRVVYEYEIRGIYVPPIKVVLGDLPVMGRYTHTPWDRKITIDKDTFDHLKGNFDDRIVKIMAHEFGHYMGRDHNNSLKKDGTYKSLMCEGLVWNFEENQEYYFNELVGVKLNP